MIKVTKGGKVYKTSTGRLVVEGFHFEGDGQGGFPFDTVYAALQWQAVNDGTVIEASFDTKELRPVNVVRSLRFEPSKKKSSFFKRVKGWIRGSA